MKIAPYIISKTYKDTTGESYSFIYDARYKTYYVLKGEISKIWGIILLTSSYEKAELYAAERKQQNQLYEFISELKEKQIIITNKDFKFTGNKYLTHKVLESNKNSFLALYTGFSKIITKNKLLNSVSLQLSYKCNLFCKHCFNPKDKDYEELSFETARKFIDEAYDLGAVNIAITGGECTYNKNFMKIAKYIREKHLFFVFLTNAQLLSNDDYFDEIMELYPYQLRISLYSMNPNVHDNITNQKGSHKKTLKVIKKLREKDIDVVINCPVIRINKNDYLDVHNFANSIGAKNLYSPYFINNPENKNDYLKLSEKELELYYFEEIKNGRDLREKFEKNNKCLCDDRLNYLCLNPNSDITLCNDFKYSLGNFKTTSLEEIWKYTIPKINKFFTSENLKDCFQYEYCNYCTYCPKYAIFDAELMRKSKNLCEHAKAYYNAMQKLQNKNKTI